MSGTIREGMKFVKCKTPDCTCLINVDELFSNKMCNYVGAAYAHAWFCRACEEALWEVVE